MSLYSVKVSLKLRAGVAQRPIFAAAEEAKKTEAEAVLKKLLASGMSAD